MLLVYPDYVEYEFAKDRLSVRFLVPYSEGRKKAIAEQAKRLLNPTSKQKASTDQTAKNYSFYGGTLMRDKTTLEYLDTN